LIGDFTNNWKDKIPLTHKGGTCYEAEVRLRHGKYDSIAILPFVKLVCSCVQVLYEYFPQVLLQVYSRWPVEALELIASRA
jgi:hypothetical protein